jgi:ferredoxin-thioredoxin reductase catalytic subunit
MTKDDLKKVWARFAQDQDFILNPDTGHVDDVAEGVLANKQKHGLGLCPCQLRDGSRERDLKIICPCNFKTQDIWQTHSRCWCGLFVKKN